MKKILATKLAAVFTAALTLIMVLLGSSVYGSTTFDRTVYSGRATVQHYNYGLTVYVTIEDDYIQSITAEHDTNGYDPSNNVFWDWAVNGRTVGGVYRPSPLQQIVETQSTDNIDVVTGATFTCHAIVQAVNNALASVPSPTPDPGGDPGDVDGNGSITIADAVLAMRGALSLTQLTAEQTAAADIDGDGNVTIADAVVILRICMELA
ncbi:MAG: FMN-binding protein [Clostridia bacterium]|nr:FMN-binding protein [Clostridia bacterium]